MNIQLEIKKMAKNPLSLTAYILISTLIITEFISLFFGRWTGVFLMLINITLVVGVWLIYATALMKNRKVSKAGITCTYAWSICQIVWQSIVGIAFITASIILMVVGFNGLVREWIGISIGGSGIFMLIFTVPIQVFLAIYFGMLMKELKKIKLAATSGVEQKLNKKFIPFTIVSISIKGFYIIFFIILGVILSGKLTDLGWVLDLSGRSFLRTLVHMIGNHLSVGALIMGTLNSLIEIAFFVLIMINFMKYNKIMNRKR